MSESLHRSFRLLPSEQLLWHGGPKLGIPRSGLWVTVPLLCFTFGAVSLLFAGLVAAAGIPALTSVAFLSFYFLFTGVSFLLAPRYLLDPCEYAVTDRHVIWKRGQLRRAMDRSAITYARIRWHRSEPGVGDLELVRATPFGPLARRQRFVLHDVHAPDRLLALVRGAVPADFAGFCDVQLVERLDKGERVLWGASPLGPRLGRSELLMAFVGGLVLFAGGVYAYRMGTLLLTLEELGLPVRSWTWLAFFLAVAISTTVIVTVGAALVWKGSFGARADGSRTEYILTDSRVLIRRGRTELSVERRGIVDVAEQRGQGKLGDVYLILDGPHGTTPDDGGAHALLSPPRATVPPVLYELRDPETFRALLFARDGHRDVH